jgi:ATP-dependent Lhr-like helicase
LVNAFRLLEERGEIRGGRFVSGFYGEQFALPEALESLRAFRSRQPNNRELMLSAADPLNLIGIIIPGDRVAAVSSKVIALPD